MMKKSSLGRRSSCMGQGRLSCTDKNASKLLGDGKKSFIPKPTYGGKSGRSSSADRDLNMSSMKKEATFVGLQRSKSYLNIDINRTSTPCFTPVQQRNTGSLYGRLQMSEGGRRTSSFGGMKSAKKDSRPITDKDFQKKSTVKITEFFRSRAPDLLDKGSIKPMTMAMFSNLVGFLVGIYDSNLTVNRKDPINDIQNICQVLNYRGKVDTSWLRTVNVPHSWPHVISFLVWLVELFQATEALNPFEVMYPEDEGDMEEPDEQNFRLMIPHLLKGYVLHSRNQDDSEEMSKFIIKHKESLNIDEHEIECRQKEYNKLQEELNNSVDEAEKERLESLILTYETLKRDIKKTQTYNYETESYLTSMNEKLAVKLAANEEYEKRISDLKEEERNLRILVNQQEMSPERKKEIETIQAELKREIQRLNEEINEYKDEVYKEDIELVRVKSTLDKMIRAFNKDIITNSATMPELKKLEIVESITTCMDAPDAMQRFDQLDKELNELKVVLKTRLQEIEENIAKTRALLQKKEAEMIHDREESFKLEDECKLLKKEKARQEKALNDDEEQMRKMAAEIQENIEREKQKIQLGHVKEETELSELKKKREKDDRRFQELKHNMSTSLENRRQNIKAAEKELEKMIRESMAERKRWVVEKLADNNISDVKFEDFF